MIDTARTEFTVDGDYFRLVLDRHESSRTIAYVIAPGRDVLARVELSPNGTGSTLRPEQAETTPTDTATPQKPTQPHKGCTCEGDLCTYLTTKISDTSRVAAGIGSLASRGASIECASCDGLRTQLAEARQQRDQAAEHAVKLEELVATLKPADDATQHEAAVARLIAAYPWLEAHPAHVRQLARAALGQARL